MPPRGELQADTKNLNFEIFESTLYILIKTENISEKSNTDMQLLILFHNILYYHFIIFYFIIFLKNFCSQGHSTNHTKISLKLTDSTKIKTEFL